VVICDGVRHFEPPEILAAAEAQLLSKRNLFMCFRNVIFSMSRTMHAVRSKTTCIHRPTDDLDHFVMIGAILCIIGRQQEAQRP
jgi:hypothetical protein